jgi:DNA-binding SARP family transcriptional activator
MSVVMTSHGRTPAGIDSAQPRAGSRSIGLSLLGGFEVSCAGNVTALPLAAQRVAAFVALHERPVQRGYIAGRLWTDATESRAHASLRSALWRARSVAGGLFVATATHLSLDARVCVDLCDVLCCARSVLRHAADPSADDLACLVRAGDLLPDWYDDWLLLERERIRQLRLLALEALCDRFRCNRQHVEAAQAGLAAVAAEPLRESAHRALIRAHLADGNPSEAIRQYRILAALLRRELGLTPSREARALIMGACPPT